MRDQEWQLVGRIQDDAIAFLQSHALKQGTGPHRPVSQHPVREMVVVIRDRRLVCMKVKLLTKQIVKADHPKAS